MRLQDFFTDFYEALSSEPEQRIFLFMAGKQLGKGYRSPKAIRQKEDIASLIGLFREKRLGELDVKRLLPEKGQFIFVLENSAFRTELKKPSCNVASGLLAGYVEKAYGRYAGAKETKCVSQGDPRCEFDVRVVGRS